PAIQQRLEVLLERTEGRRLVTSKTGKFLTSTGFYKEWVKAVAASGVRYRVPYTTRHTFAAWSLIINVEPLRLHKLMGHGSKKMVYEVYGIYVERLEEDREQIAVFFGEDFTVPETKKP
ncbi:MAG TPA: integrase, partial [Geomonas sp.]